MDIPACFLPVEDDERSPISPSEDVDPFDNSSILGNGLVHCFNSLTSQALYGCWKVEAWPTKKMMVATPHAISTYTLPILTPDILLIHCRNRRLKSLTIYSCSMELFNAGSPSLENSAKGSIMVWLDEDYCAGLEIIKSNLCGARWEHITDFEHAQNRLVVKS
ncbi:hypothetical protein KSP39_PZI018788 [Platanthera zijinensis]|uniref:Uncharacterized protein n=1 Tax=Platanthera zijinensis TaxID=2320716 RepID=A0AAP0B3I7_9ASPA